MALMPLNIFFVEKVRALLNFAFFTAPFSKAAFKLFLVDRWIVFFIVAEFWSSQLCLMMDHQNFSWCTV